MDLSAVGSLTVESVTVRPSRVIKGLLLAVDQKGRVRPFTTPEKVVKWIKARDLRAAQRGLSTATVVEWEGMPAGFTPPEA